MSWLIPRNGLTPDQIRAIEMAPTENRAIVGGPGSGKTQILLHRARWLCDRMNVAPDRYRILVFTNVLKDYIRSALQLLDLSDDAVMTFDHWCRLLYEEHINPRLPWNSAAKCPNFAVIRSGVRNLMASGRLRTPLHDFIMVDEGQDLEDDVYGILQKAAAHITVCFDAKQKIYDVVSTETGALSRLGIRRNNISLIEAFRVCPYLVEAASVFIHDDTERQAFRNQTGQSQIEKETPVLVYARSADEERELLYDSVRERQLRGDRIAILLPLKRQVYGFARGLTEVGIEVEVPSQRNQKSDLPVHDFASNRPKVMTYHSAKGLTFDSVFLPRLVEQSFPFASEKRLEKLLFVALTRASKWAFLSTDFEKPLPILKERISPLVAARSLTVIKGRPAPRPVMTPERSEDDELDFL